MKEEFYSNGKLLLTGEYVVLDGAKALAIPTKFGQSLCIEKHNDSTIIWKSYDEKNTIWFETVFTLEDDKIRLLNKMPNSLENSLLIILTSAKKINPSFLNKAKGYLIITKLNFPKDWGLGTSSTLINNIAQWANVNAFELSNLTFGGSGYDIAAAQHNTPILYSNKSVLPFIEGINLSWNFKDSLFFVYLNKKQNSRDAITHYRQQKNAVLECVSKINEITQQLISCTTLSEFNQLVQLHEQYISEIIKQKTVKEKLFDDYQGAIKSLGAWGGDFILATGDEFDKEYFRKKGYSTLLSFHEMILS